MADDSEEKEFLPTPQKLQEARKKGEIAKSADLNTAAAYLGFLTCIYFFFQHGISALFNYFTFIIENIQNFNRVIEQPSKSVLLGSILTKIGTSIAPIFVVPMVFVLASLIFQHGFTFTPTKLELKLNRISLISGFRNKFGRSGIFEFLKSFLKLVLFICILATFLHLNFDRIAITASVTAGSALLEITALLYDFLFLIFGLTFTIGLLDFSFQHAEHIRKNRMSRKDLEDEVKQSEGDPLIKQRRRQKAIALASNAMLADVPKASVIIVNPTHFSVALRWDHSVAVAPIVVAKGVDEIALRIREIAIDSEVPIHSNPPAARLLFADTQIGDQIRPDHYEAVAAAIRFAENIRQKQRNYHGKK